MSGSIGWPQWREFILRSAVHQWAVIGMSVLLVLGMGYATRLQGNQEGSRQARAHAAMQQAMHRDKVDQLSGLASTQAALEAAQVRLEGARWALSAGGGMSELLDQMAESGRTHGLLFERLEVGDAIAQEGYGSMPLQLQVTGGYAGLRLWLEQWLGQIRTFDLSSLRLAVLAGQPGMLRLHMSVSALEADETLRQPDTLAQMPARTALQPLRSDPFAGWSTKRSPEGLAGIPLAQLQMVGSLSRAGQYQAVIRAAGRLYPLREGEPVGREGGVVVRIEERQVEVRERSWVGGRWQERSTYLKLEGMGREAQDEDEMVDGLPGDERFAKPGVGGLVSG